MIFPYIDDWLIVGRSREVTDAALKITWHLRSDMGFLVNAEKLQSIPSQVSSQCPLRIQCMFKAGFF